MRSVLTLVLAVSCVTSAPLYSADTAEIRAAVTRAVAVVQPSMDGWFKQRECASCHHTVLPTLALTEARAHGVAIREESAKKHFLKAFSHLTDLDMMAQGYNSTDSAMNDSYTLIAAHSGGLPPNTASAALSRMIATRQTPEGRWKILDFRPPQTGSPFTTTALCLRALQLYMPDELASETRDRVRRAAAWLAVNNPSDTEDRAYQLLGLAWAKADASIQKRAAGQLIAEQRADGGWGQLPRRPSDAYATGQSLVALQASGAVEANQAAFDRGIAYLLKTQKSDGSWHVVSRIHDNAPISPPYFETGFPHGKDQFNSMSGTCWAIRALAQTLPASNATALSLAELTREPAEPWVRTALFGTANDLDRALNTGLDPNRRTPAGTTVLMFAAADPVKVKLLLGRGADANARAKTGLSPLMVAASYGGALQSAAMLIERGADVNNPPGKKAIFNGSALMSAIISGEAEKVALLLEKGANPNQRSIAFSAFTVWPLLMATFYADQASISHLVKHGAMLHDTDQDGSTVLSGAALSGHAAVVRQLAKLGAKADFYDNHGMTPLLWASTIEYASGAVVEALIEAGADPNAASKSGLTPISQARKYGNTAAEAALRKASAGR
ncbi:MAG: ankyrin repeat domain-containing protein [Acidobacteriia bacterium]|nr:ankyrin repeat domain-containing protein [Terriglobia bacterium]